MNPDESLRKSIASEYDLEFLNNLMDAAFEVESLEELPPLRLPEPSVEEEHPSPSEDIPNDSDDENPLLDKTDDELRDEQTGQLRLF